jgi:hypothetical protein
MLDSHNGLLSGFPNELIREILHYCEPSDLVALCQTGAKILHVAATEFLYTRLDFQEPYKAVGAFLTILKRPLAAASVRHLVLWV